MRHVVVLALLTLSGCQYRSPVDAGHRLTAPCIATDGHGCQFNIPDPNTDASTSAPHAIVRAMMLGDSNTSGITAANTIGSYRTSMWASAVAAKYQLDFVGDQANGPGYKVADGGAITVQLDGGLLDHNHEGIGGSSIESWQAYNTQHQLCREFHPDVIAIALGTNNVNQGGFDVTTESTNYAALVDQLLSDCTGMSQLFGDSKIIIVTVPPQHDTIITNNAAALNVQLKIIAASRPRTIIADLYPLVFPYNGATNFADDKHLSQTGIGVWASLMWTTLRKLY